MKEHKLMCACRFHQPQNASTAPHHHNYYELTYHISGHGHLYMDGEQHEFSSNHFVLVAPFTEHYENNDREGEKIFINFYSNMDIPVGVFRDQQSTVLHILETLYHETLFQSPFYEQMIHAKLTELVVMLMRINNDTLTNNCLPNLSYIINYISENYHEKIQMNLLAEQSNYCYGYFQKCFKKLVGESPQQFLIHKRIDAAKTMLKNSSISCTDIAIRCGFSSSSQMALLFKRETGISPLQYRKKK